MSQTLTLQYRAQTPDGSSFNGTVDAVDVQTAREQLVALGLTVLEMKQADTSRMSLPRRSVTSMDMQLFNQQLINLTKSGLPIEQGLRLIAQDIRSSRLKTAVNHVIGELDRGQSLSEAFESQRSLFPPMYAKLMEVGTQTGRLPGVLFNLGQHLQMIGQLKTSLYRAFAYPSVVFAFFVAVMCFMSYVIGPQFREIFADFDTDLPSLTVGVLNLFDLAAYVIPVVPIIFVIAVVLLGMLRLTASWSMVMDVMTHYVPILSAILRRNVIARWCDAVRMGVEASMDLPTAMSLADNLILLPSVSRDTVKIINCLEEGRAFASIDSLELIPATVLASIELSENPASLLASLEDLTSMYRQQAYLRMISLESVFNPLLLVGLGLCIGSCVFAMFLPFLRIMSSLT